MNLNRVKEIFRKVLMFDPNADQLQCITKLSRFLLDGSPGSMFLLKGYAGTGKTSLISALVKVLPYLNSSSVLLAPTGRAAKVMAGYSGVYASTIHKKIYRLDTYTGSRINFRLIPNNHFNTVFIVDEGSMISDDRNDIKGNFSATRNLLDDLVSFIKDGKNCRLILVGDSAQLAPVGMNLSPAMDEANLKAAYNFEIWSYELKTVVRQEVESGILHNATLIRKNIIGQKSGITRFKLNGFNDIFRLSGNDASEKINELFSRKDFLNTTLICRSNKRACLYNQFIRSKVLFYEDEISAGDLLMVVKNNYFWLKEGALAPFIANGDIFHINRVKKIEEIYGCRFATITGYLLDYDGMPDLEVVVFLDTLKSNSHSMQDHESGNLIKSILAEYPDESNTKKRYEMLKSNPYFNALQVKFAYAITCHKAQGGQWENVFVEMPFLADNSPDTLYYRWLYTAFTRASKNLYLLGFSDNFF